MANQVTRLLLLIPAGVLALTSSPYSTSAFNPAHIGDYPDVTVEHAELVRSPDGIPDTASLTIYNGTNSRVSITQVSADGYKNVVLVKRSPHLFGLEEVAAEDGDLGIPPMADYEMGEDSVFISMERSDAAPNSVTITVTFDDGSLRSIPARVVDTAGARTRHHHGAPEFE